MRRGYCFIINREITLSRDFQFAESELKPQAFFVSIAEASGICTAHGIFQ